MWALLALALELPAVRCWISMLLTFFHKKNNWGLRHHYGRHWRFDVPTSGGIRSGWKPTAHSAAVGLRSSAKIMAFFIIFHGIPQFRHSFTKEYYGTALKATYSVFEATFSGSWPLLARPLIEHVSEWSLGPIPMWPSLLLQWAEVLHFLDWVPSCALAFQNFFCFMFHVHWCSSAGLRWL